MFYNVVNDVVRGVIAAGRFAFRFVAYEIDLALSVVIECSYRSGRNRVEVDVLSGHAAYP